MLKQSQHSADIYKVVLIGRRYAKGGGTEQFLTSLTGTTLSRVYKLDEQMESGERFPLMFFAKKEDAQGFANCNALANYSDCRVLRAKWSGVLYELETVLTQSALWQDVIELFWESFFGGKQRNFWDAIAPHGAVCLVGTFTLHELDNKA